MPKEPDSMTFAEAWSARAELARGPGGNRRTPRYKALTARIRATYTDKGASNV